MAGLGKGRRAGGALAGAAAAGASSSSSLSAGGALAGAERRGFAVFASTLLLSTGIQFGRRHCSVTMCPPASTQARKVFSRSGNKSQFHELKTSVAPVGGSRSRLDGDKTLPPSRSTIFLIA